MPISAASSPSAASSSNRRADTCYCYPDSRTAASETLNATIDVGSNHTPQREHLMYTSHIHRRYVCSVRMRFYTRSNLVADLGLPRNCNQKRVSTLEPMVLQRIAKSHAPDVGVSEPNHIGIPQLVYNQ